MAGRKLAPEEADLWRKVVSSVRPLEGRSAPPPVRQAPVRVDPGWRHDPPSLPSPTDRKAIPATDTLDGGWDRRLRRGVVAPDRSIDLHGHTLATAHAALDMALERAVADDARVLLLVTGRPPRPGERRGAIRAAVGDWLASSRHAGRIAAVRKAHPRHGGAGALYVVLRRRRDTNARIF